MYPRLLQDEIILSGTIYTQQNRSKSFRCILDSCRMKFTSQVLVNYSITAGQSKPFLCILDSCWIKFSSQVLVIYSRIVGQDQTFPMDPGFLQDEILLSGTIYIKQDRSKSFRCILDSCRMKFTSQVLVNYSITAGYSKPFRCILDSCRMKLSSQVLFIYSRIGANLSDVSLILVG